MSAEKDCCCGDGGTPAATQTGGGGSLPLPAGASTQQIQLVAQRGELPGGVPNTRAIEATPDGSLKVSLGGLGALTQYVVKAGDTLVFHSGFMTVVPGSGS